MDCPACVCCSVGAAKQGELMTYAGQVRLEARPVDRPRGARQQSRRAVSDPHSGRCELGLQRFVRWRQLPALDFQTHGARGTLTKRRAPEAPLTAAGRQGLRVRLPSGASGAELPTVGLPMRAAGYDSGSAKLPPLPLNPASAPIRTGGEVGSQFHSLRHQLAPCAAGGS